MGLEQVAVPCAAHVEMMKRCDIVRDLVGGTRAMRDAGEKWLPREEAETEASYRARIGRSFLYPGFTDALVKLRAKPFSEPVKVANADQLPEILRPIENNADKEGSSLTQFAAGLFTDAAMYGMTHVLVDYPSTGGSQSRAAELGDAYYPYFVHVSAENLLGWDVERNESTGNVELTRVRIRECSTEKDGDFGEVAIERVRVISRGTWELYRKGADGAWSLESQGSRSLRSVGLVTVYFERDGFMACAPPLEALAWTNLEHWQSSSEQRNVLHVARVPILFEQGVTNEMLEKRLVISAGKSYRTTQSPGQSDLRWVEHSGASIQAGKADLESLEDRMRVLGMQPLVEGVVKTATEVGAGESHKNSGIKAWIRSLNDALFDAYALAAEWVGEELPDDFAVSVHSEFGLDARSDADMAQLLAMRAAGDISRRRLLLEAHRRGKFGEDFDLDAELEETGGDMPNLPDAADSARIDALRNGRSSEEQRGTTDGNRSDEQVDTNGE